MSVGISERQPEHVAASTPPWINRRLRWQRWLAWGCLAAVLIVNVPLFVHMPLDTDVIIYDLCARSLLRGHVEYRHAFEHGMPGMTWVQAGVRSIIGWTPETLRLIDLVVVGLDVALLLFWLVRLRRPRAVCVWAAAVLAYFYFSTSENSHCQRDLWMLLPALIAVYTRGSRLARALGGKALPAQVFLSAAGEGIAWGIAFWIKPFVAAPALACWLVSSVQLARGASRGLRLAAADAAGMIAGGLVAGAAGIGWLIYSGAWPSFVDIMLHWNPEYYEFARSKGWSTARLDEFVRTLAPWSLVHVVAVPLAILHVVRGLTVRRGGRVVVRRWPLYQALFAAFYLGWLVQALFLQNLLEYIQVAPVLLGLTVIAGCRWSDFNRLLRGVINTVTLGWAAGGRPRTLDSRHHRRAWGWVFAGFLTLTAVWHPMFRSQRWSLWPRCWQEWASPELRDQLGLNHQADWVELENVAKYLRDHAGAWDGRTTCYSFSTPALYLMLDVEPPTRFFYLDSFIAAFPGHRQKIIADLAASKERFVVTDVRSVGFDYQRSQAVGVRHFQTRKDLVERVLPPEIADEFPWSLPFDPDGRFGSYTVHHVKGPINWPGSDTPAAETSGDAAPR